MWLQKEIIIKNKNRGFHLITTEIKNNIPELSSIKIGILHIFIKHSSASITINENSDKSVNLGIESSEFDRLDAQGYKSNRTGFSTGSKFEYYDDLFLGISIENFAEKVTVNSNASSKQKKSAGNFFDSFLVLDFDYDKRNQKFATTDGFFSNYSIILISFSKLTPVFSKTFFSTKSIKFLMSSNFAFPLFIKKLQCFSEI